MMRLRVFPVLILSAVALSGCGALVVTGAAEGGYQHDANGRNASMTSSDADIVSAINRKYVGDATINALDITVRAEKGVVTLYGRVPDQSCATRAVSLARATRGVKTVVSRLTYAAR
jgi:hypothetical protein